MGGLECQRCVTDAGCAAVAAAAGSPALCESHAAAPNASRTATAPSVEAWSATEAQKGCETV